MPLGEFTSFLSVIPIRANTTLVTNPRTTSTTTTVSTLLWGCGLISNGFGVNFNNFAVRNLDLKLGVAARNRFHFTCT
uniref:Uncharacterized protein n=1 Tax=Trypanosoma brucei TaxID=5691 RepID=Q583C4_9TRYP|nr:hypothetical protein, unlikely [Trypanosoma brucei]